jgi:hypothetical protein
MLRAWTAFVVLLAAPPTSAQTVDMRRPKRLIATGWDHPDTGRLRQNLDAMQRRPFDGTVVEVTGQAEGKPRRLRGAFAADPWQRKWFQAAIDDLRATHPQQLRDNFVLIGANPGNVDWFDDAGWRQIVDHWRIAAWIARQGGVKGILFDPEPYSPPWVPFRYDTQPQRDKHTFDEYYAKARQRGREIMQAVAAEYPDLTLFCYFMNSICAPATGQADPRRVLRTLHYGLYPALIDGWLDVAPPAVTFVDGCESAYLFNSTAQFLEAGLLMRGACQELVSPENRAKYRAQVQVGFGIYLDAYWNPKPTNWYIDGLGGPRVNRLSANVEDALRVADQYVWIYGEKFRWWPTPNGGVKAEAWSEALPGSEAVLALARDPVGYARSYLSQTRAGGKLVNLLRNGDFSSPTVRLASGSEETWRQGRPPAGWRTWQEKDSHGTFTWDQSTGAKGKGSVRISGVAGGCALQGVEVKPNGRYVVRAMRRVQGHGEASIRVRWQTSQNAWTAEVRDRMINAAAAGNDWAELIGVVQVPESAGRLVVLLGAAGQRSTDDQAWFDDVEVVEIGW